MCERVSLPRYDLKQPAPGVVGAGGCFGQPVAHRAIGHAEIDSNRCLPPIALKCLANKAQQFQITVFPHASVVLGRRSLSTKRFF